MTKFGITEASLGELITEAATKAIEDADSPDIEAILIGCMNPEEFTGNGNLSTLIADELGLTPIPSTRIETASSTGAVAFNQACLAVMSGSFKNLLVIGAEKMSHITTKLSTKILAKVIDPRERKYGATMPALAALVTRLYMHRYNLSSEELAQVAVKNHRNGALNPFAHFQKKIEVEDVLGSRMIADPLRLYDCSPMSDGACALILTSRRGEVKVSGLGHGTDTLSLQHRESLTSFKSTRIAATMAYKMARKGPNEIDVAEVHDAFTSFEIISTEDLRFFKEGEGKKGLLEGKTALDGDLPVNPSGGLKARGHPIGASGLAQIIEIYWQLSNNSRKRQVDQAKVGLTQSTGGLGSNNLVTILEAC